MKSVRRKAYFERKHKKCHIHGLLYSLILPLIVILSIFAFIKVSTRYWNGSDKFAFVFRKPSGEIGVTAIDPILDEITTLIIPGETQVNVAEGYGTLRIKNVWQLGINEKKYGRLLSETVMQNFNFPVFLWGDMASEGITNGNFIDLLKFIFSPGRTNIPFGDRISISVYSLKIHDLGRNEIDLAKGLFLHKEKLNDGEMGYRLIGPISQRLTVYFSNNYFASKNLKFYISDATGTAGFAQKVGEILETLGGKVVSIDRKIDTLDFDCEIAGNDPKIMNTISKLFSCNKTKDKTNFDLEVRLGTKFAKRF